ncbi:MAG: hypothetical protein LBR19_01760 [Bifidobacteriaceae bacterium]|jgi:hypothetical protein|nr:hypothetical protein [Bifidobacteriaceae bacterium]
MKTRRFKACVAGAAGVALLLGGTTFALWSDSIRVAGAEIIAGDLDLDVAYASQEAADAGAALTAYDTSPDRLDSLLTEDPMNPGTFIANDQGFNWGEDLGLLNGVCFPQDALLGHPIALFDGSTALPATQVQWNAVPGDQVTIAGCFKITLQGDNLVAELRAYLPTELDADGNFLWEHIFRPDGYEVTNDEYDPGNGKDSFESQDSMDAWATAGIGVKVYLDSGTTYPAVGGPILTSLTPVLDPNTYTYYVSLGYFQAPNESFGSVEPGANVYTIGDGNPSSSAFNNSYVGVLITLNFPDGVEGQDLTQQDIADLTEGLKIQLNQTRDPIASGLNENLFN